MTLENCKGESFNPLEDKEVDPTVAVLIDYLPIMLSQMMGEMGQHFYFFVFEDLNVDGERNFDPLCKGELTIRYKEKGE